MLLLNWTNGRFALHHHHSRHTTPSSSSLIDVRRRALVKPPATACCCPAKEFKRPHGERRTVVPPRGTDKLLKHTIDEFIYRLVPGSHRRQSFSLLFPRQITHFAAFCAFEQQFYCYRSMVAIEAAN